MTSPTDLVYHYTNPIGFMGVLQERELWATEFSFMNDPSELTYAAGLVVDALREKIREIDYEEVRGEAEGVISALEKLIEDPFSFNFLSPDPAFPISFSDSDEHLTLWRLYSGQSGFVLGFDKEEVVERVSASTIHGFVTRPSPRDLDEVAEKEERIADNQANTHLNFSWVDVKYGAEKGAVVVEDIVEHVLSDYIKTSAINERFGTGFLVQKLHTLAHVKHEAFRDEHEIRLLLHANHGHDRVAPRVRVSPKAGVVPFHAMKLPRYALRTVTVAPGQNQAREIYAAKLALASHGWTDVEVRSCEIPYAW